MDRNQKAEVSTLAIVIALIIVVGVVVGLVIKSIYIDTYTVTGTVSQKFLSPDDGGTTFVVMLDDGRKLEIKRNLWYGGSEYNEDSLYADIDVNSTYHFTCWGWQLDLWFIYWYPNIIRAEEV
jgi:hypothetical protein